MFLIDTFVNGQHFVQHAINANAKDAFVSMARDALVQDGYGHHSSDTFDGTTNHDFWSVSTSKSATITVTNV